MMPQIRQCLRENLQVIWLFVLAAVISLGWFFLDGDVGVNFSDEGYLWYGTHAMRAGQVPMRDFQGYDPGRYCWTTAWSYVLGDGLVPMRLACTLFGILGVTAGLLCARRLSRHPLFLVCMGLMLCAWMHPRYKLFEQTIALLAVYAGVLLLEKPALRRHFAVGVFGGLSAFFGRNHGAYHVFVFSLLIGYAAWGKGWGTWCSRSAAWAAGLLVGYLPHLLMFVAIPGYFGSFIAGLHELAAKGTNLATDVMWPWLVTPDFTGIAYVAKFFEGTFYVLLLLFLALAALRLVFLGRAGRESCPVLIAAFCVTLAYSHYVFSRPDVVHLAHDGPTMVLGVVALGFTLGRAGLFLVPVLTVASFIGNLHQYGATFEFLSDAKSLFTIEVAGHPMVNSRERTQILIAAKKLARDMAKPDESIWFIPNLPGMYPYVGRKSPTKQIYFIYPATPPEERAILTEIEGAKVQWVMMHDYALDGRDELRFRNGYPMVFAHLQKKFGLVKMDDLPSDIVVLHRLTAPAESRATSEATPTQSVP